MRKPWFLKSKRRRSAERRAALITPIKAKHRRTKSNGHNPREGKIMGAHGKPGKPDSKDSKGGGKHEKGGKS